MVLNHLWIGFFVVALLAATAKAVATGDASLFNDLIQSVFSNSRSAFEIALGLCGTLAFWLGILRVAEKAGFIVACTRALTPLFRKLMPEVPDNHPALGAMVMNLAANTYGGNAKLGIEPVNFSRGYGLEMRGGMTQMMDSFRRLLTGLWLALIFMYLVLVVQFRGFLQPLQMIASLPLELAGVFIALWLAGQAFSTVSILGIIVLTGMDITTAVLLIDMIMKYRDKGIPRDEAIRQACPQRLRPILMTAGITLIVMLPIAIAPKTGLDAYQPLAMAVVGGLIVGTILSLFDIPIMHTYVDDFTKWLNKTFLNREWKWEAPESTPSLEEEAEERL